MTITSTTQTCQRCPCGHVATPAPTRRTVAGRMVESLQHPCESLASGIAKTAKLIGFIALAIVFSPLLLGLYLASRAWNHSASTPNSGLIDFGLYGFLAPLFLIGYVFSK